MASGPTDATSRSRTASGSKRDQDGLDVYERIVTIHARRGVGAFSGADRGTRYRWYGSYTQRPEEDGFFMLRGRVPNEVAHRGAGGGGGRIRQRFGRDVCDVTDRQLHWTRIEDVPEIWARLGAVSLTTHQTYGDVTRSIIGCPLAGVARDETIDTTPAPRGGGSSPDRHHGILQPAPASTRSRSPTAVCSARCTR